MSRMLRARRAGPHHPSFAFCGRGGSHAWERHALSGIPEGQRFEEFLRELLFVASLPPAERISAERLGARVFVGAAQFLKNHEGHLADRRLHDDPSP